MHVLPVKTCRLQASEKKLAAKRGKGGGTNMREGPGDACSFETESKEPQKSSSNGQEGGGALGEGLRWGIDASGPDMGCFGRCRPVPPQRGCPDLNSHSHMCHMQLLSAEQRPAVDGGATARSRIAVSSEREGGRHLSYSTSCCAVIAINGRKRTQHTQRTTPSPCPPNGSLNARSFGASFAPASRRYSNVQATTRCR